MLAVVSGSVFGALGAWGGRALGGQAGEHGVRLLGKRFWTLMGGIATGLAAAYSTYRYQIPLPEKEKTPEPVVPEAAPVASKLPPGTAVEQPERATLSEAMHQGVIRQLEMGSPTLH